MVHAYLENVIMLVAYVCFKKNLQNFDKKQKSKLHLYDVVYIKFSKIIHSSICSTANDDYSPTHPDHRPQWTECGGTWPPLVSSVTGQAGLRTELEAWPPWLWALFTCLWSVYRWLFLAIRGICTDILDTGVLIFRFTGQANVVSVH